MPLNPLPHGLDAPDLAQYPLLHDDSIRLTGLAARVLGVQPGWAEWFQLAAVVGVDTSHGTHFDDGSLVLQVAAAGGGVVLGRKVLAAAELASGSLIAPFDITIALDVGYLLVIPEARTEQPMIAAFRRWVLEEAASFAATLPDQHESELHQ